MEEEGRSSLSRAEANIGYSFKNIDLLREALAHSSYVNELKLKRTACYERLEFLGDSILEFVSSDFLMKLYPDFTEGELSKHRASLVCEKALAARARKLELGSFILLGKGEAKGNGRDKDSILCDVMESVIGAIYCDSGLEEAREFIYEFILKDDDISQYTDYKTILQEIAIAKGLGSPEYELLEEKGPDHDKVFVSGVRLAGNMMGTGRASNKKEAERRAAAQALEVIK